MKPEQVGMVLKEAMSKRPEESKIALTFKEKNSKVKTFIAIPKATTDESFRKSAGWLGLCLKITEGTVGRPFKSKEEENHRQAEVSASLPHNNQEEDCRVQEGPEEVWRWHRNRDVLCSQDSVHCQASDVSRWQPDGEGYSEGDEQCR